MPRPKRPPHLRYMRDSFSGPAYIVTAARIAAGVPSKQFAPWLVSAMEAKLQRENPGLLEKTAALLATGHYPETAPDADLLAAEPTTVSSGGPSVAGLVEGKLKRLSQGRGASPIEHATDKKHRRG